MRIFAGDTVPGLALLAQALPPPWVLPDGIGRRHRNRLVRLLHTALHATQPALRLGELRWGERDLVERGRMSLPSEILIRWRIDLLPGLERREVMRECERLGPRLAVFDFGPGRGEQLLAWLGPFKLEALRRLTNALLDHAPVKPAEQVVDVLNELAERLQSPVDLIDAAETMVEQIALGQAVSGARAEACARVLVGRFEDGDDEHDGTDVLHALAALADGKEPTGDARALLESVGLTEPGDARPLPLAELVREDEIHRRAQRMIATQFSLREPAPDLDLDLDGDAPMAVVPPSVTRAIAQHPGSSLVPSITSLPGSALPPDFATLGTPSTPRAAMLQRAWNELSAGDGEEAAKLVIDAMRSEDISSWSPSEAGLGGLILSVAAAPKLIGGDAKRTSLWVELSADILEHAGATREAAELCLAAAQAALAADDAERAMANLARVNEWIDQLSPEQQMQMHLLMGQARFASGGLAEAEQAYHQALELAEHLDDRLHQLLLHLELAEVWSEQDNHDAARHSYERALALSRELDNRGIEARSLFGLGTTYFVQGNLKQAEQELNKALDVWPSDDPSGKGYCYQMLATALAGRGKWKAARQQLRRALTSFQEAEEWDGEADALDLLGRVHLRLQEIGEARTAFEMLLASSRNRHDAAHEAEALAGMSKVLCWLGDPTTAKQYGEQALTRAREAEAFDAEMNAWGALGHVHRWTGTLDGAEHVYHQALERAREAHDESDVLPIQLALAAIEIARGETPHERIEESRRLAEADDDTHGQVLAGILTTALQWSADVPAVLRAWTRAAEDLERRGRHTEAAFTRAMAAVADGEPLGQVADKLAERLGVIHPLPERVRAAASPTEAIRAIIAFL